MFCFILHVKPKISSLNYTPPITLLINAHTTVEQACTLALILPSAMYKFVCISVKMGTIKGCHGIPLGIKQKM